MNDLPWDQRLARVLVRPLVNTPVHPNVLTAAGLVMGLTAAFMFARGDPGLADWAALLYMVAVFMDHTDGELARLAGKTSRFGHYFDHVCAVIVYVALFVGVGFGLEGGVLGGWAAPMGIFAGLSVGAIFAGRVYVEERFGKEMVKQENYAGFQIGDTLYIVGPVTWLGGLVPFLTAACIGAPLFLIFVLWQARKCGKLPAGGRS